MIVCDTLKKGAIRYSLAAIVLRGYQRRSSDR